MLAVGALAILPWLVGWGIYEWLTEDDDDSSDDDDDNTNSSRIVGTSDDDALEGRETDETIIGVDSDDTLVGYQGSDHLIGGEGDDSVSGGIGADLLAGGDGDDSLRGGQDADLVFGQDGDDTLTGNNDDDDLLGGAGDDSLTGGPGGDFLFGGQGIDTIEAGNGNDVIWGFAVAELDEDIAEIASAAENETPRATIDTRLDTALRNADWQNAGVDDDEGDVIFAGADNDTIFAGADDTVTGGEGEDDFIVSTIIEDEDGEAEPVTINDYNEGVDEITILVQLERFDTDGQEPEDFFEVTTETVGDDTEVYLNDVHYATLLGRAGISANSIQISFLSR